MARVTYAVLQSIYEYMIVLKTRELEGTLPGRPPDEDRGTPEWG